MLNATQAASEIGENIASRRKSLGVTQEELAELAGVSVRFLSSLENGKPTIRLDTLIAVLDALGLDLRIGTRGRS